MISPSLFFFSSTCIMPNRQLPISATNDAAATPSKVESKIRRLIIQIAFDELLKLRKPSSNGTSPCVHGSYTQTIDKYYEIGHTWLKRQQIIYLMEVYRNNKTTNHLSVDEDIPSIIDDSVFQDVSTITDGDEIL
jgi:hypothetical protein